MTKTYGNAVRRMSRPPIIIDMMNPEAVVTCDGCGFWVNRSAIKQRMEFRGGTTPVGTGLYVCPKCDDVPNAQYAKPVFYADPYPIKNPRPDPAVFNMVQADVPPQVQEITAFRVAVAAIDEQDINGWTRCTTDGDSRVPIGWPNLGYNNASA